MWHLILGRLTSIKRKRKKTKKIEFKCDICSEVYHTPKNLRRHFRMVHPGKKPFACEKCKKRLVKVRIRNLHVKFICGVRRFSCNICKRAFHQKGNLKTHIRTTHFEEKPYEFNIFGKKIAWKSSLKIHMAQHNKEKLYECGIYVNKIKAFFCKICEKRFSTAPVRDRHVKIHSGEKQFSCGICKKAFYQKGNLKNHIRTHTGEKPYECNVCKKKFTTSTALKRHMEVHYKENLKKVVCKICEKSFSSLSSRNYHMKIHSSEKPFSCDTCKKTFRSKQQLNVHIRLHTGEKPYECNDCGKKFTQSAHLKQHVCDKEELSCKVCEKRFASARSQQCHMKIHSGKKPFSCDTCKKAFIYKANLQRHMRTHTREKPYDCNVCGNKYGSVYSLQTHMVLCHKNSLSTAQNRNSNMKMHTDEKPFSCKVERNLKMHISTRTHTNETFTQKIQLKKHLKTHDKENLYDREKIKPFVCEICEKGFSTIRTRDYHMKIHSDETPYSCDISKRAFHEKEELQTHSRIHTGEKPYECNIYGKEFAQSTTLKQHIAQYGKEQLYQCGICDVGFATTQKLTEHTQSEHYVFMKVEPEEPQIVEVKMKQDEHRLAGDVRKLEQNIQTIADHQENNVCMDIKPEEPQIVEVYMEQEDEYPCIEYEL